jgi:hypothetical protein
MGSTALHGGNGQVMTEASGLILVDWLSKFIKLIVGDGDVHKYINNSTKGKEGMSFLFLYLRIDRFFFRRGEGRNTHAVYG